MYCGVRIVPLVLTLLQSSAPAALPAAAAAQLTAGFEAARVHDRHVWRDVKPIDAAGFLTGFIEIPRGERRKYEFDIAANRLRLDRVLPPARGGYPVNYGFVPQTVSYDGDPFDVLVLGPPHEPGTTIAGVILGIMHMEDEKGPDSKVVISPIDAAGLARFRLTAHERERITRFFKDYKRGEPGKFSRVSGWGSAEEGRHYVQLTHAFFTECRGVSGDCVPVVGK